MACDSHHTISFDEIIQGRDSNVRVTVDGFICVVDLVMAVTGKNRNDAGQTIRNLGSDIFHSGKKFTERRLSRNGGALTKLVSLSDAIELIMVLPGRLSKLFRKLFADVLIRYLDGDLSMCREIEKNKTMGPIKSYTKFVQNVSSHVSCIEKARLCEMPLTTYIYATKSSAFPGLIKIGKTVDVSRRLSQLNTGCAPAPHEVISVAPTFDNDRDERLAHAFFADFRKEGEFFEVSENEVCKFFSGHITSQYSVEMTRYTTWMQGLHIPISSP